MEAYINKKKEIAPPLSPEEDKERLDRMILVQLVVNPCITLFFLALVVPLYWIGCDRGGPDCQSSQAIFLCIHGTVSIAGSLVTGLMLWKKRTKKTIKRVIIFLWVMVGIKRIWMLFPLISEITDPPFDAQPFFTFFSFGAPILISLIVNTLRTAYLMNSEFVRNTYTQ